MTRINGDAAPSGTHLLVRVSANAAQAWRACEVSTCKSCGAAIIWCITPAGKWAPVDAKAEKDGAHLSHFATCSKAETHRKRKGVHL